MKRKNFLSICAIVVLALGSYPFYAYADEVLYQGYHEEITVNGQTDRIGLRIKDGKEADGRDSIAYCYDIDLNYPVPINEPDYKGNDDKCYYSKIENYLESDDEYITKYGETTKQKVAMALYAGYPCDAYGYREEYPYMSNDEARLVTQNMVWDITIKNMGEYDIYRPPVGWSGYMVQYYNTIYNNVLKDFKEGTEFHQGWLDIIGDFEFQKMDGYYQTGEIKTKGEKGTITFLNVDPGLEILDWNTDKPITNIGLSVGDSFYVKSTAALHENQKFELNYSYDQVKFCFYKHRKGGQRIKALSGKGIQNMIRVEPTNHKAMETFVVTLDGNKVPAEKTSVAVRKEWVGTAAESATIYLEANGAKTDSIVLNKENGWSHTFTNLDKYDAVGTEIQYTVQEEPMKNYQTQIIGNMMDGFVVVNSETVTEHSGSVDITEDTMPGESGSLPDGTVTEETEENSGSVDITEDTMPGESGSLPDGTVTEETEESSGSVDITEDTMPGESGSLPDGTVTEETEENSGSVDITEDTMLGENGSLPDGIVMEEIEDTAPDKATTPNNSIVPNKTMVSETSVLPSRLDHSPKTGDNSHIHLWIFLSFISLSSAILILFTNPQKSKM